MLLYRFIDLTLSNMGLIFTEHLICFSHCSKCFTCMDSFNLNSLVVIIPQFTREESETREVSDLPKVTRPACGRAAFSSSRVCALRHRVNGLPHC